MIIPEGVQNFYAPKLPRVGWSVYLNQSLSRWDHLFTQMTDLAGRVGEEKNNHNQDLLTRISVWKRICLLSEFGPRCLIIFTLGVSWNALTVLVSIVGGRERLRS